MRLLRDMIGLQAKVPNQRRVTMSKMIYINLPVADLAASTRFYEAIGCEKNEQFSDHQASSMVWSDAITFQLMCNDYFATFTPKTIADAHATSEVLLALSRDSREEVDAIVAAAVATGGKADIREPQDMGWLYTRAFQDPDGHVFEAISAEMAAAPAEMAG
jgi:predicted lactoylglutathione lyase